GSHDRQRTAGSDVDGAVLHGVLQAQLLVRGHVEDSAVGAADALGAVRSGLGGGGGDSSGGSEGEDSGDHGETSLPNPLAVRTGHVVSSACIIWSADSGTRVRRFPKRTSDQLFRRSPCWLGRC